MTLRMLVACRTTVMLCVLALLACSKPAEPVRKATQVRSESASMVPRLGTAVAPSGVWPIPAEARRLSSGVRTARVFAGVERNKIRGPQVAMVLAFARYDTAGRVVDYAPAKLLGAQYAQQPWREVYELMSPGQVRRVWIEDANGNVSIYDVQLLGYLDLRKTK